MHKYKIKVVYEWEITLECDSADLKQSIEDDVVLHTQDYVPSIYIEEINL